VDFWLNRVGRVTPRWPLSVLPGVESPTADAVLTAAAADVDLAAEPLCPRAPAFLGLPRAEPAQREWFEEAFAKIGADADRWAYTEHVRPLDGRPVLVVRFDPSRPEIERSTLMGIGGRAATTEERQRWREEEHEVGDLAAELARIQDLVDRRDVRLYRDEPAAIVFELPLCGGGSAAFPPEKFQALFRVNKTSRSFEDIVIKAREPIRAAPGLKLTDVGLEVRFRTLDAALAPQPVHLKGGGAMRLLLVKVSCEFEVTRTDFQRVEPFVTGRGD
jgi:hypothetical protein